VLKRKLFCTFFSVFKIGIMFAIFMPVSIFVHCYLLGLNTHLQVFSRFEAKRALNAQDDFFNGSFKLLKSLSPTAQVVKIFVPYCPSC
jgi:hypothetical protein